MKTKININSYNYEQERDTALTIAIVYKYVEMSKLLINAGIDINAKNYYGNTPLMLAWLHDVQEVFDLLSTKADWGSVNWYGDTIKSLMDKTELGK